MHTLLIFSDPRVEAAYLAFVGRRSKFGAVLLHSLVAVSWCIGCLKWVSIHPCLNLRCFILVSTWAITIFTQLQAAWELHKLTLYERAEQIKLRGYLASLIASLWFLILLKEGDLPLTTPVTAAVIQGGMILFEQFRLHTALKLHLLTFLAFGFTEADKMLELHGEWRALAKDVSVVCVSGLIMPLACTVLLELAGRNGFLQKYGMPDHVLSPFWQTCAHVVARVYPSRPS